MVVIWTHDEHGNIVGIPLGMQPIIYVGYELVEEEASEQEPMTMAEKFDAAQQGRPLGFTPDQAKERQARLVLRLQDGSVFRTGTTGPASALKDPQTSFLCRFCNSLSGMAEQLIGQMQEARMRRQVEAQQRIQAEIDGGLVKPAGIVIPGGGPTPRG